jgi:hypothetical protein
MKRLCFILMLMPLVFLNCSKAILQSSSSSIKVDLSSQKYTPKFQTDKYSALKNKNMFLSSMTNNAKDTTVFYYFSPDFKIRYGKEALSSYFWYCFAKAFNRVGIVTYKDTAPSDIPEFTFEFDYLTDQKINCQVTVLKRYNVAYQRKFEIIMPAPESQEISYLEDRAYKMIDNIVTNILDDQNFVTAL